MDVPAPLRILYNIINPRALFLVGFGRVLDYYETLRPQSKKHLFSLFIISLFTTDLLPDDGPLVVVRILVRLFQVTYVLGIIMQVIRHNMGLKATAEAVKAETDRQAVSPNESFAEKKKKYVAALLAVREAHAAKQKATIDSARIHPPATDNSAQASVVQSRRRQQDVVVRRK